MKRFMQFAIVGFLALTAIATPYSRVRRQERFSTADGRKTLVRGGFTGFGEFQPGQNFLGTGRGGLTIPANGGSQVFNPINSPPPIGGQPGNGLTSGGEGGLAGGVFNSGFQQRPRQDQAGALNSLFVRDQRQTQNNFGFPQQFPSSTTSRPVAVRTTPSQQFLGCLARCPSVNQYNPVCGSDGQTYHNEYKLDCSRRCGLSVIMMRAGTCQPV